MEKLYTLCIVETDDKVLLAKKKSKIGVGLWNGYGGKVEESEDIEKEAIRELTEESGGELVIKRVEKRGIVKFHNGDEWLEVHVFSATCSGEPCETAEMGPPTWFKKGEIPFGEMMGADKIWFPYFLSGKPFQGVFRYGPDWQLKEEWSITKVAQLE